MSQFELAHLAEPQFRNAYPLIAMTAPDVSLERWLDHAACLLRSGGGILGLFAGDSSLHGVATYRIEESLRHGRALRVDRIVTFELSRKAPARRTLCHGLELLALALRCTRLSMALPHRGYADAASAKAASWRGLGLDLDEVVFAKSVRASRLAAGPDGATA